MRSPDCAAFYTASRDTCLRGAGQRRRPANREAFQSLVQSGRPDHWIRGAAQARPKHSDLLRWV